MDLRGEALWDRIEHDLVERVVTGDTTPCLTLGLTCLVGHVDDLPVGLRLARDTEGRDLVLTEKEGRIQAEQASVAEREGRIQAEQARLAAETRLAELEASIAATKKQN